MTEKQTWYQRSIERRTERAATLRRIADRPGTPKVVSLINRMEAWRTEPRPGDAALANRLADQNAQSKARLHDQLMADNDRLALLHSEPHVAAGSPTQTLGDAAGSPIVEQPSNNRKS